MITTAQIVQVAKAVAKREDGDSDRITDRRVGRVLGRMRLQKTPRPGGKGSRRWRVTLGDLQRWTAAYGLILPAPAAANGTNYLAVSSINVSNNVLNRSGCSQCGA